MAYYSHFIALLILLIATVFTYRFYKQHEDEGSPGWLRLYLNMLLCLMLHNGFLIARDMSRLAAFQLVAFAFLALAGVCAITMLGMVFMKNMRGVR